MAIEPIAVLLATENEVVPRILHELDRGARTEPLGIVATRGGATGHRADRPPDVIVADIVSHEGIRRLPELVRRAPVVVVCSLPAQEALVPCIEAGARGFVVREEIGGMLEEAVASVAAGHTFIDPSSADWLVAELLRDPPRPEHTCRPKASLSSKQLAVLHLVDAGLTNTAIARDLGITENSVKTHLARAMQKLGVHDRSEAARAARKHTDNGS